MTHSPLNLVYRWNPIASCLQARHADNVDAECNWRASLVPSVQAAMSLPGEIEAMIAARDRAVDMAAMEGVK